MWYIIIFGLLTLSVAFDASRRKLGAAKTILWAIGTFLLGVIVVPIYLAKRPLKVNEVREGGLAWNLLKNFALTWTILMVAISISAISAAAGTDTSSGAEAAGAAIGIGIVIVDTCRCLVCPDGRGDCIRLLPQELSHCRAWTYRTFGARS